MHTILIVEDNSVNMKLFHDLLEAHGYDVVEAPKGMDGFRLAQERRPDLIIMDIQLPDVSGLDVTRWLKRDDALRHIPVIVVTAFAMKGDKEKALEAGCDAYIAKPIAINHFLGTIREFLS